MKVSAVLPLDAAASIGTAAKFPRILAQPSFGPSLPRADQAVHDTCAVPGVFGLRSTPSAKTERTIDLLVESHLPLDCLDVETATFRNKMDRPMDDRSTKHGPQVSMVDDH